MALQKLVLKPGINKDATPTAGEGGWYDADKVRFRNGMPEKIGGWMPATDQRFLGTARALITWATLDGRNMLGIGTNLKYYTEMGGSVTDITPVRSEDVLEDAIQTTTGSSIVTMVAASHGAFEGDFIEIEGVGGPVGGIPASALNREHRITYIDGNSYSFDTGVAATSDEAGGGEFTVKYQVNIGLDVYVTGLGWGADGWGQGGWGDPGVVGIGQQLTLWNHAIYGQTLLYGVRGGPLYVYDPSVNLGARGYLVTGNEVPKFQDVLLVSDVSRFVIVFGTNDVLSDTYDPMVIRWSDQEDYTEWTPAITNQAGSIRISDGSYIVTALQTRQEILVWSNSALYSMQYVGPPFVWSVALQMSNISIMSPRAAVTVNNLVFWMGTDKFYVYSGRVDTLPCTISAFIFADINRDQSWQVFSGTNEGFNEVWWFYCSKDSTVVDRYVVYNHVENVWSHGTMKRSAWLDSAIRPKPIAATMDGQLVYHEVGNDDGEVNPPRAINAYIQSSDIDIGEGDRYGFVWRMIPDITFIGSDSPTPVARIGLYPRRNPGASYQTEPLFDVARAQAEPVETFTEYVYTRVRGRQMALRVYSDTKGTQWRLGAPRIDVRTDGRKT